MLSSKTPIKSGSENAPCSTDPRSIFLAPRCCYTPDEGRQWCEDNVWPCTECPDPKKARVARYALMEQIYQDGEDCEASDQF